MTEDDDGTVWIEKGLSTKRNAHIQVKFSFEFCSESERFSAIATVIGFAGISNPEVEAVFVVIRQANEVSGWNRYTYTVTLKTGTNGEVWVAFGISVRRETEMTYNVDDVEATIG